MPDQARIDAAIANVGDWTEARAAQLPLSSWPNEVLWFLDQYSPSNPISPDMTVTGFFGQLIAAQTQLSASDANVVSQNTTQSTLGVAVAGAVGLYPAPCPVTSLATKTKSYFTHRLGQIQPTSWTTDVLEWAAPPSPLVPPPDAPPLVIGFIAESMHTLTPAENIQLGQLLING